MFRCFVIAVVLLAIAQVATAYPTNYLSSELGARLTLQGRLVDGDKIESLLSSGPVSKGGVTYADGGRCGFVADLGAQRQFDRVDFGSGNGGTGRAVKSLKIGVSASGVEGTYRTIFTWSDFGFTQVLRLPPTKARWVRFDFGECAHGPYVHSLRLYKGYKHPRLAQIMSLIAQRMDTKQAGLANFRRAASLGKWTPAAKELRRYYASRLKPYPPMKDYDTSRVQALYDGKIGFAGIDRDDRLPIDWVYQKSTDWYEHKNFLNRGAPLGVPVDAYYNTGNAKWGRFFKDMFYDWVDANPKPEIMSRADYPSWRTLDSALRADWLVSRFDKATASRGIDDELWANYLYSIWEHADYLKNDDFDGGNWLAMTTTAVMRIALTFPEFADRKKWLEYGKSSFETNVLRDIRSDGKEVEDSPNYVCMAYTGMFSTLVSLEKAGVEVNPETRSRLNKVLDFVSAIVQPNGVFAQIGDGGGPIAYGLEPMWRYFKREDVRYVLTQGKEGTMPKAASVNFPEGGWSVMRSAYDEKPYENARQLVYKLSADSHGHRDVHQVTVCAYGRELLIDPGIASYEAADVERYLHTAYHNTICIDGNSSTKAAGTLQRWFSNAGVDYLRGTHHGYKNLDHARSVLFVKPDYWLVEDEITGEGEHTYQQNWHFPADAGLQNVAAGGGVVTSYKSGGDLLLLPLELTGTTSEPFDFFIAHRTKSDEKDLSSQGWRFGSAGLAPKRFTTLLYPFQGDQPELAVRRLPTSAPGVVAVEVKRGPDTDYIVISGAGAQVVELPDAGLNVDGEIAVVRISGGVVKRVSGANLKSVTWSGKTLFSAADRVLEVDQRD